MQKYRAIRRLAMVFGLGTGFILGGFAAPSSSFPPQAEGTDIRMVRSDAAGNVYIAGSATAGAFVAKYSPDGQLMFRTFLDGSADDGATALAVAADGGVYVAGGSSSADFPVSVGAIQSVRLAAGSQAFLAKLAADGRVEAATFFGGAASAGASALAVDRAGEVYLTGTSAGEGFPVTEGYSGSGRGFYLAKFSANLRELRFATLAHGGTVMAIDAQGAVYTAAALQPGASSSADDLTTPGAFQRSYQPAGCYGTLLFLVPCSYQFVEKVDAAAKVVSYATYLTGTRGASPAGIVVDSAGNAIVAGTTNSADYPVTANAMQTSYPAKAAAPPPVVTPHPDAYPPPATGFLTKLNAAGSGLLWSTFFGGSGQDAISGLAVDGAGNVYVSGVANSADLPGVSASAPKGCVPSAVQGLGFVAQVAPDGGSVSRTKLLYGASVCTYAGCSGNSQRISANEWSLAVDGAGGVVVGGWSGTLRKVALAEEERLACVTDSADNVQISKVAPGQLLSLFGEGLGAAEGLTVRLAGVAAPVIYAGGDQVNVQVPYEVAGADTAELAVDGAAGALAERRTVALAARQPSVLLAADALLSGVPGYFACGLAVSRAQHALAIHADGTVNSCEHGAAPWSTVTVFVNGMGRTEPALGTGEMAPAEAMALTPAAEGAGVLATTTSPGAVSGLARIQVQVGAAGFYEVRPVIDGVPAREAIGIWVAAP